jgi:Family of unknown function (DUF6216)
VTLIDHEYINSRPDFGASALKTEMDFNNLSAIPSVLGVVAPLLTVALFGWAIWRTGSRHALLFRLWKLVHGNKEVDDPEIQAFINEQNSLMSFRFFSGVNVKTLENARHLIRWTKQHDVEMRTVSWCGEYFDPDLRQVLIKKLPSAGLQKAQVVLIAMAVVFTFLTAVGACMDRAILKFKESDRLFLMSSDRADPLWPLKAESFQLSNCSSTDKASATRTTFTEKEIQILCAAFNKDAPGFLNATVKEQRISFIQIAFIMFCAAFILFKRWINVQAAGSLTRRKLTSDLPPKDTASSFNQESLEDSKNAIT